MAVKIKKARAHVRADLLSKGRKVTAAKVKAVTAKRITRARAGRKYKYDYTGDGPQKSADSVRSKGYKKMLKGMKSGTTGTKNYKVPENMDKRIFGIGKMDGARPPINHSATPKDTRSETQKRLDDRRANGGTVKHTQRGMKGATKYKARKPVKTERSTRSAGTRAMS